MGRSRPISSSDRYLATGSLGFETVSTASSLGPTTTKKRSPPNQKLCLGLLDLHCGSGLAPFLRERYQLAGPQGIPWPQRASSHL